MRPSTAVEGHAKRQKISRGTEGDALARNLVVRQALLAQFYPEVWTLREYLLSRLPTSSKIRRKKIISVGHDKGRGVSDDRELASFLDRTLIGITASNDRRTENRWQHWASFSQRADDSASTLINLNSSGRYSQSEVNYPSHISTFRWDRHCTLTLLDCEFCHMATIFQNVR